MAREVMLTVGGARFSPFDRTLQPRLGRDALNPLAIDRPSGPFQQGGQAAIAISRVLSDQIEQRCP